MVPYHGGAFLPIEQRFTSPIYRRLHRIDHAEWLSLSEAAELVAVIRLVGFKAATALFRWNGHRSSEAARLMAHAPVFAASEAYHEANLKVVSPEDGEACLRVILEGRWHGRPPDLVLRALQAKRRSGESIRTIAASFGLQYGRVRYWLAPRKPSTRAKAAALLAIG